MSTKIGRAHGPLFSANRVTHVSIFFATQFGFAQTWTGGMHKTFWSSLEESDTRS